VRERFLDTLLSDPARLVRAAPSGTTRQDYEALVLRGGFPLAIARDDPSSRGRWFTDFVNMVVERDVLEIRKVRQRSVLPLILRRLAGQTAQLLNASAVANLMAMDAKTVGDFIQLLESVFLVHKLEAYGRTLSGRVSRSPKVHLVDTGLAAHLLGVTASRLSQRGPATLTEFGHILETFAVNEVLKQGGWSLAQVRFSHFRTKDDHEVDLVCEAADGRVAGIEVKAAGSVSNSDFRGLRMLKDKLGEDFIGGVVLYLGRRSYAKEERLHVLPMDSLWTPA
jgi:predicted AAA+ superfamily ATPase